MTEPARLPELAPMPLTHEHRLKGTNRVLGATAGPTQGNVRAILAVLLTAGLIGVMGFLAVADYGFGIARADALLTRGFDALLVAFGLIVGMYFGTRSTETGGGSS